MARRLSNLRRRTAASVLAACAVGGALAGPLAGSAAATTYGGCHNQDNYVICFTVEWFAPRTYKVHVGVDYHLSPEAAQDLLDRYGTGAINVMVDSDDGDMNFFPSQTWIAATADGLSAEWDENVQQSLLNEDDNWWDRRDEIEATVGVAEHRLIHSQWIRAYF